jgi:hypothetical protein
LKATQKTFGYQVLPLAFPKHIKHCFIANYKKYSAVLKNIYQSRNEMILSFAWTTDPFLAGLKTVTRRDWGDRTFAQWCKAWDERRLVHSAWDKNPRCKGKEVGTFILTAKPYRERLGDFPEHDLAAEGGLWETVEDYINLQGGDPDKVLTVVSVCKLTGGLPLNREQKSQLFHKLHRQSILAPEIAQLTGFSEKEVYRTLDTTKPPLPPEEQFGMVDLTGILDACDRASSNH